MTSWFRKSFTDYDIETMRTFLLRFPRTTLNSVLEVAHNMWRHVDGKHGDSEYSNFQRFLYRLSAVDVLKIVRPQWSMDELRNYMYSELNRLYATIEAGCQKVCNKSLDPYHLVKEVRIMPVLLDVNNDELVATVERVVRVATGMTHTVLVEQYMNAVSVAVKQADKASREQQDKVLVLVDKMQGAQLA